MINIFIPKSTLKLLLNLKCCKHNTHALKDMFYMPMISIVIQVKHCLFVLISKLVDNELDADLDKNTDQRSNTGSLDITRENTQV